MLHNKSSSSPNLPSIIDSQSASFAVVRDRSNSLLIARLRRLLCDGDALATVASRSYRHQLGFLKLVLEINEDGRCLRLHFWDQASLLPEDPHSHCASFQSRIVVGAIRENVITLADGDTHTLFKYRFDAAARHVTAVVVRPASVMVHAGQNLCAGDIYRKHASELHSVTNVVKGTITVSAWESRSYDALVLKPMGATAGACEATLGMAPEHVIKNIQDILNRLNSQ